MFIALMVTIAVLYLMDETRKEQHRELMEELQALRMQLETPQQRQQRVYGHE